MIEYIYVVVALIVSIFAILCICCFGTAGWLYIRAEQLPPMVDRLVYVGSLFGLAGFVLAHLAYYLWLEIK